MLCAGKEVWMGIEWRGRTGDERGKQLEKPKDE
jgi:hypothetical protein